MSYINWEYYSSLYSEVTEEDFEKLILKAETRIDSITHMRVKRFVSKYDEATATDFQKQVYVQVKNTLCDMVNKISVQESTSVGNGVTSVSNDGYSENYAVTTQAQKDDELKSVVLTELSGTGLAGVL